MDLGFNGVHALVTGASGGIGFAITQLFLEHGARVTGQYNTGPGPLTKAKETSDRLEIVQANMIQEEAVKEIFERGADFFKQEVQVLILNHGIFPPEDVDLVDMDLSQWQRSVDVNLTGSFLVAREFLRRLRKSREGYAPDLSKVAIVVMGSTSGDSGEEGHVERIYLIRYVLHGLGPQDYACTKSALQVGLIRTLKTEITKIAPAGRVNAISPGWVNTSMAQTLLANDSLMKRTLAATPLGRIATTLDVATQTLILASSTVSAHVTGTNIILAGGLEGRVLPDPAGSA